MKVIWDPTKPFRTFADPVGQNLSIISTVEPDDVMGQTFSPIGVIVTTPTGYFCDLDLVLAQFLERDLVPPHPTSSAETELVTHFAGEAAELYFHEQSRTVLLQFGDTQAEQWVSLGASGVLLGLRGDDLRAIYLTDVVWDPGASIKSAWIDSFETLTH